MALLRREFQPYVASITHPSPTDAWTSAPIPSTDTARLTAQLKSDLQLESQIFGTPRNSQPLPVSASAPAPIPVLQGFTGSMPALPSASVLLDPSTPPPTPHSRSLAAIQFAPILSSANLSTVSPTKAANVAADQSLAKSLPELSKWLLLASFYAGFNPPKTDVRNFVKVDEGIAKKGKKGKKATVKKPGTTIKVCLSSLLCPSSQLTGGWIGIGEIRTRRWESFPSRKASSDLSSHPRTFSRILQTHNRRPSPRTSTSSLIHTSY